MKFEFDSSAKTIASENGEENIVFHCNSTYQYYGLCKQLLTPIQQDKHIALMNDGIYYVSKERLKAGIEYMKNNPFNDRK